MRTLQQTIDAIIEAGLYTEAQGQYMCNAANRAVWKNVITQKERDALVLSVGLYIVNVTGKPAADHTMCCILWRTQYGTWRIATPAEVMALYKDWNNRPRWRRKMRTLSS